MSFKVTDKRMFTEDGELREDYSYLDEESDEAPPEPSSTRPPRQEAPLQSEPIVDPGGPPRSSSPAAEPAGDHYPGSAGAAGAPQFLDLVAYLAEPIALLLGDARLPNGESAQDLDQARALIDLLEILQLKTSGNLESEEQALLDDLLYRLRMRYVEKRRG